MAALKTLFGIIAVLILGLLLFVYTGVYNVAADEPHLDLTRWLLQTAQSRSVAVRADGLTAPRDLSDPARVQRGGLRYGAMCQLCHLGPGVTPTPLHQGLKPKPPLLRAHAAHHSPENLFWTVKHGIKMTGMPAWGKTHTDEQLWDIVAFVEQLPHMTPEQFQDLTQGIGGGQTHSGH